jgi:hypothetical protein
VRLLLVNAWLTAILAIWVVSAPGLGGALAGDLPAPNFPDPPSTAGPIIADGAVPAAPGSFAIQPYLSLSLTTGTFSPGWRRVSAGGDFVSLEMPVKFTGGLAHNLEAYAIVPVIVNWAGGVTSAPSREASFGGLGDIFLAFKYQLLAETACRPTVTALLGADFPTGHHFRLKPARLGTDALGTGTYALVLGTNLSKWLNPFYLHANLWYSIPFSNPGTVANQQSGPLQVSVHGRDQITWNLAAEWVLTPRWVLLLEFYSTWDVGPLFRTSPEPRSALLGVLPGLECNLSAHWAWEVGVAVDLAGKYSFANVTPIFTVIAKY